MLAYKLYTDRISNFESSFIKRFQPFSCYQWLDNYFFCWRNHENADISKNIDVMGQIMDGIEFTHGVLLSRNVSFLGGMRYRFYMGGAVQNMGTE